MSTAISYIFSMVRCRYTLKEIGMFGRVSSPVIPLPPYGQKPILTQTYLVLLTLQVVGYKIAMTPLGLLPFPKS